MSQTILERPGILPDTVEATEGTSGVVIAAPDAGKTLFAFGDEIEMHLGGTETGGRLTVFTDKIPPGGGPPPHYHTNEEEWFVPLGGEVEFFIDGRWQKAASRSVVFVPRGVVHTFRNVGETPLDMLTFTSPAGFEVFFERCAVEFAIEGPPNMERIVEISAEHGIFYVND